MRTFTNKPGTVFDAEKTTVIFAEDMNEIVQALTPLPLSLADYWTEVRLMATGSSQGNYVGYAVGSGSGVSVSLAASVNGFTPHGLLLRSSATANSGYHVMAISAVTDYFGQIAHKFFCDYMFATDHTSRIHRFGFLDSSSHIEPTDGAYFSIADGICVAKTVNNGSYTTSAVSLNLSLSVAYRFDIEVNKEGTSARFRVFEIISGTKVFDETLTTNIPVEAARAFRVSAGSFHTGETIQDLGVLYTIASGTVNGFLRSCGYPVSLPNM